MAPPALFFLSETPHQTLHVCASTRMSILRDSSLGRSRNVKNNNSNEVTYVFYLPLSFSFHNNKKGDIEIKDYVVLQKHQKITVSLLAAWGGYQCEWYYVVRNTIGRRVLRSSLKTVLVVGKTHGCWDLLPLE
jgi:hypothetical protein